MRSKSPRRILACINADLNHLNSDGVFTPVNTYIKNIAKFAVYDGNADRNDWEVRHVSAVITGRVVQGVAEAVIWILQRIPTMEVRRAPMYP